MRASVGGGWWLGLWLSASTFAATPEEQVRQATFTFVPAFCAGAVVGNGGHGITAAHCIQEEEGLAVRMSSGAVRQAKVAFIDRARDVAILEWEGEAEVQPLRLAQALPRVGDAVLFAGRPDRAHAQQAVVSRLGQCPSLPGVAQALFTTIEGRQGDSGSPLVDHQLQVVGLVHGGAACNIATPTASFAPVLSELVGQKLQCAPGQP